MIAGINAMETNNVEASTRVLDAATSAVGTHAAAGDAPAAWHPTYADCVHFKSLLEYFVAHLEWKVNHDRGRLVLAPTLSLT